MKQIIPIFFACDDNYAPFLSVALASMLDNADKNYFYRIHVLTSGFRPLYTERLSALAGDDSEIIFIDPTPHLKYIAGKLHLRDYYSVTTYYRLFIAEMFPEYDRVLYLDADTVIPGDISKLYFSDLRGKPLGAVQEDVMNGVDVFGTYAEVVLGVPRAEYFNAGVLVMELDAFRELRIEDKFVELVSKYTFRVTQDEDYLNVLFYENTQLLGYEWNKSPDNTVSGYVPSPQLIHFKLNWKPWHYSGTMYEELFWAYASKSAFSEEIYRLKAAFGAPEIIKDKLAYERLMRLAAEDIASCDVQTSEFRVSAAV